MELKIRVVRETLLKLGISTTAARTPIQWETIFINIVNTLDNHTIATGNSTNANNLGCEIITPNPIKQG